MNIERLNKAIGILTALPEANKFDFSTFGERPVHGCGTKACAWGWVAMDQAIQSEGVRTEWDRVARVEYLVIKYGDSTTNLTAAGNFFDISYSHASWLFGAESYPKGKITIDDVISRMRETATEGMGH